MNYSNLEKELASPAAMAKHLGTTVVAVEDAIETNPIAYSFEVAEELIRTEEPENYLPSLLFRLQMDWSVMWGMARLVEGAPNPCTINYDPTLARLVVEGEILAELTDEDVEASKLCLQIFQTTGRKVEPVNYPFDLARM